MHETFMPPPKPDVLAAPAEPELPVASGRRWLTIALWTAIGIAGLCFALLVAVDRAYGWPAYAALACASLCTVARSRLAR